MVNPSVRSLANDEQIDGVPCRGGALVHFDEAGRLVQLELSREHAFDDVVVPAGSLVALDEQGRLLTVWPAQAMRVDGVEIPARACVQFHDGALDAITIDGVTRDARGNVRARIFASNTLVDRWEIAPGRVSFHENGRLRDGALAREATIDEVTLPAGARVGLAPDGSLVTAFFAEGALFGGERLEPGTFLRFERGRVVERARLSIEVVPLSRDD